MMSESVWDYPRPPRLERLLGTAKVVLADPSRIVVAESSECFRYLETSHPPVIYFPPEHVNHDWLVEEDQGATFCEWKGVATYFSADGYPHAAWTYRDPMVRFLSLTNYIAFYARVCFDCYIDDVEVTPQPGSFYGGWIYSGITGPFKGDPIVSSNW